MEFSNVIKMILFDSTSTVSNKKRELTRLKGEIDFALEILEGDWKYCKECNDYYREPSFFEEEEVKMEKVCIYDSPINSGDNEYEERTVDYTYLICPKGHKIEVLERIERQI